MFLSATLKSQEKPQLYNLFKKNSTELDRERKLHSEQLKKLQYQLTTKEQRLSQYHKRYNKIQVICSSDHFKKVKYTEAYTPGREGGLPNKKDRCAHLKF